MNIFVLDRNPAVAATLHCNKHVVKMITESGQLLSTAHRVLRPNKVAHGLYRKTHENHICNTWIRAHRDHYYWLYKLLGALLEQYDTRYAKRGKYERLRDLYEGPLAKAPFAKSVKPIRAPEYFVLAMKSYPQCYGPDAVAAYRRFYILDKHRFARWPRGQVPWWFVNGYNKHFVNRVPITKISVT